MKIVELVIDENQELFGIDAISLVDEPAIELDFIALKKQIEKANSKQQFAVSDGDKRILVGPALVPDKPIYRNNAGEEYYVYFSKRTVKRAMELFLKEGYQKNMTLQHDGQLEGLSVVESWIVDDPKMDKSQLFGMDMPKGTWMVSIKVDNEEVWMSQVKEGNVKGFSIEGYFVDRAEQLSQQMKDEDDPCWAGYEMIGFKTKDGKKVPNCVPIEAAKEMELESYSDYPDSVKNNAKKVIDFTEENGWGDCGTPVGKTRANTLAKGDPVSVDTIKRMNSYLIRHKKDLEASTSYTDGCGLLMYDSWGGKAALKWTESKLNELELVSDIEEAIKKEG